VAKALSAALGAAGQGLLPLHGPTGTQVAPKAMAVQALRGHGPLRRHAVPDSPLVASPWVSVPASP